MQIKTISPTIKAGSRENLKKIIKKATRIGCMRRMRMYKAQRNVRHTSKNMNYEWKHADNINKAQQISFRDWLATCESKKSYIYINLWIGECAFC